LELLLLALAVARLTVLVRADRISQAPRYFVANRVHKKGYIWYLLDCSWCIGMWIAAAVAISAYFWWVHPWYRVLITIFALSYVVGALGHAQFEPDSDLPERED
jgi:hypothetical protein